MRNLTDLELCQRIQDAEHVSHADVVSELVRRYRDQWSSLAAEVSLIGQRPETVGRAILDAVYKAAGAYKLTASSASFNEFASSWILHEVTAIER